MSKKHFIALADAIRLHNTMNRGFDYSTFNPPQIHLIANFLASQNSRFNRERWLDYIAGKCGPNGGAIHD